MANHSHTRFELKHVNPDGGSTRTSGCERNGALCVWGGTIGVLAKADPLGQQVPEGGQQGGACVGETIVW